VERKRATQRRYVYTASRDPIAHVDYGHAAGSWRKIFVATGWRPSRAFIIGRSKLDAESIRYLAEFDRKSRK
jgi:hypothetical protein